MNDQGGKEECLKIAKAYIKDKGEDPEKFTFKFDGGSSDKKSNYVVNALWDEDFKAAVPGAGSGKSVQLMIDLESQQVTNTLRFQ